VELEACVSPAAPPLFAVDGASASSKLSPRR
jgi:hypothetical protein